MINICHEGIKGTDKKLNKKRNTFDRPVSRRAECHLKAYGMFTKAIFLYFYRIS